MINHEQAYQNGSKRTEEKESKKIREKQIYTQVCTFRNPINIQDQGAIK